MAKKRSKGKGKGVLDAGVHFEVGAHRFCGIDTLCFLPLLSFFFFGGFGGAGDRRFGVDFGGVDFWLNVGRFVSRHFWGGLGFGVENIVGSGFCSLFGGETVEFILCGYEGGILGVGRMGGG